MPHPVRTVSRLFLAVCAALLLGYGVCATALKLYAAKMADEGTLDALDRAVQFDPGNAEYRLRRADLLDQVGLSGTADLKRAAELNPGAAAPWIQLSLDAEARHDLSAAEQYLLEAARRSRLFQPRWTLANYYFRRGPPAAFWYWTRQALELAPRDAKALFALCWRMSQDPDEILTKAVPGDRRVLRQYTEFLLAENRLGAAEAAVARLYAGAETADRDVLLEFCDRLLTIGKVEPAMAAWNALCRRGLVPSATLRPSAGLSLTNGGFAAALRRGFDWHINAVEGVSTSIGSGAAEVYLSGNQPERVEALWQWIPVMPARQYLLEFEYQTSDIPAEGGLCWQIAGVAAAQKMVTSPQLSSSVWKQEAIRFDSPADAQLARVILAYARRPGMSRIQGSLLTRAMRLQFLP